MMIRISRTESPRTTGAIKRVMLMLLITCLVFAVPVSAADPWDGQTISTVTENNGVYEIINGSQLAWIAKEVNDGSSTFSGKTVILTDDIDLSWGNWTPIGLNSDDSKKFLGTFDGNYHTISHLNVTGMTPDYTSAGLFGSTPGTLQNFIIAGAKINHTTTSSSQGTDNGIAVVAGSNYVGGTIKNVTVKDAVVTGNRYVAGVVGYASGGQIVNCTVSNVTLKAIPDTLTGYPDNGDKVGGVVGFTDSRSTTITDCSASAVDITAYRDAGGLVGHLASASTVTGTTSVSDVTITVDRTGITNYGNSATIKAENVAPVVGRDAGGIVSQIPTVSDVTVTSSTGVITKTDSTGNSAITISTLDQLKVFRDGVNAGTYKNVNVVLTASIDLGNNEWEPIGTDTNPFIGTFDGQDFTISNLKNTSGQSFLGLFGKAGVNDATIKNLVLRNVEIEGDKYVGAIVGSISHGTCLVENCKVTGTVKVTGSHFVGGLAGWAYADFRNCHVVGDTNSAVTGSYSQDDHEGDSIGGLVGQQNEGSFTIENCNAAISVSGTRKVGGLVGSVVYGNSETNTNTISGSSASGAVHLVYEPSLSSGFAENKSTVGSLIGEAHKNVKVTGSKSTSLITIDAGFDPKNVSAGFIGGTRDSSLSPQYNNPTTLATVTVTTSAWTPSAENYEALQKSGYLKLSGVFGTDAPVYPEPPKDSSSSSGSSVWLTEIPTETPTPTPTETATPTDTVPTDIPVTQPTDVESPGFGVFAVLAGLGAVAVLRRK